MLIVALGQRPGSTVRQLGPASTSGRATAIAASLPIRAGSYSATMWVDEDRTVVQDRLREKVED
jgi:hypothetical protein